MQMDGPVRKKGSGNSRTAEDTKAKEEMDSRGI